MIPTDFHIFQRGGSTTNQLCMFMESLFAIQKILLKMTPLTVAFFFSGYVAQAGISQIISRKTPVIDYTLW